MKKSPVSKIFSLALLLSVCIEAAPTTEEKRLGSFYAKNNSSVQSQWLSEVVRETEKRMKQLCIESELDTFLSMGHRESGFDMTADDSVIVGWKRRSIGIYQTRNEYFRELREFWLKRGQKLEHDDAMETQCAFGVAEFYLKLKISKGDVWLAVRRYNGAGWRAMTYARNVMISRKVIFKRSYVSDEKIIQRESCQKKKSR